jgi:hypothetical protein
MQMSWLMLVLALGLGTLWIIALSVGAAAPWFLWLVFVAAVALFIMAGVNMVIMKKHTGKPV